MKKSLKISIVLAVILALLIPYTISYGTDEEAFFEVISEEITVSDVIEATINIDEISYDNFIFNLTADFDISSTEIVDESDEETDTEDDETEIIVEDENDITIVLSKSSISLSEITLVCALPEDIAVGDTVTLVATVINSDNEEESETVEITITIVESTISAESTDSEYDETTAEVGTEAQENTETADMNMMSSNSDDMSSMDMSGVSSSSETSVDSTSLSGSDGLSEGETISYNGSDNCYLSELSVNSYELNKTFSKECTTYFITIDDDTDSIDVTATAEDDGATICIYGDDDISTGENKVLITVTAENGNTRTYRIYVTKS